MKTTTTDFDSPWKEALDRWRRNSPNACMSTTTGCLIGIIERWSVWLCWPTIIRNGGRSDIDRACDLARLRFFVRPRYIARKAWQSVREPDELVRNLKAFRSFLPAAMESVRELVKQVRGEGGSLI